MKDIITAFTDRLQKEWLPSFCNAPHRKYPLDGFKLSSIERLHEFDALWFMQAVDDGLVSESKGSFVAPKSSAKEQIFWEGEKSVIPRPITLWIEPIITIGALARLHVEYGWPIDNLGAQSKTWAFDLVCYENASNKELVACEVKKDMKEIEKLLAFMNEHCRNPPLNADPENSVEKNAYRKVQSIRRSWPKLFWALGPNGNGQVFCVHRENDSELFNLVPIAEEELRYKYA
ncbi:hypothetical protein [Marinobacterium mangrovicola]|uniref:Uncharacterized protein n=1 Tax=Marinobacterium mangrovicola TaxID=1476959 RepID=A0A4R1GFZ5_9GAMM|nr:hypothetical protein [Marinobacterium mangrovicola]TCK07174.1 hypothetical protein CLV83_2032 [Marinobacterium mangrovicola]